MSRFPKSRITKAVFPVAGLGTRFLPATKSIPKEILTLVDRPLIDYAVEEAREAGIEQFIFVTSRGKSALSDYFDDAPHLEDALARAGKDDLLAALKRTNMESSKIAYVRQNRALGLGHAVWCARSLIMPDETFAVMLPDEIFKTKSKSVLSQMMDQYHPEDGAMIATTVVPEARLSDYGVLDYGGKEYKMGTRKKLVQNLVEKPRVNEAPSANIVVGRYILGGEIMDYLSRKVTGVGGEIQLTDAIANELSEGRRVTSYDYDGYRYDCGSKVGYLEATVDIALSHPDLKDKMLELISNRFSQQHAAE